MTEKAKNALEWAENWIIRILAAVVSFFLIQAYYDIQELNDQQQTILVTLSKLEIKIEAAEREVMLLRETVNKK